MAETDSLLAMGGEGFAPAAPAMDPAWQVDHVCEYDLGSVLRTTPNDCYFHVNEYIVAAVAAFVIPLVRYVLDRTLYKVGGGAVGGACIHPC